jgi:hypothetical protein
MVLEAQQMLITLMYGSMAEEASKRKSPPRFQRGGLSSMHQRRRVIVS